MHPRKWVDTSYDHPWTGEHVTDGKWEREWAYEDIDVGRFKCVLCNEVMYYSSKWRNYWEGNCTNNTV